MTAVGRPMKNAIVAAVCLVSWIAHAQEPKGLNAADVDPIFAAWNRADSAGMSVAVIERGVITFSKGYGSAQLEHDTPITDHTVFHAASISKQFAAIAILLLEQEGKLSLDANVSRYLDWAPRTAEPITVRQLIFHTSGLRDMTDLLRVAGWHDGDVVTQEQVRYLVSRQRELNFAPGSRHEYTNTGYFLLAEIVAAVSGQSLREFAEQRIFKPLGMRDTHFHDDPTMIVRNRAYSYETAPDGHARDALLNYATVGSTGLLTTSRDLVLWLDNFRTARVGGRAVVEKMQQTGVLNDGSSIDYAYGITVGDFLGRKVLWHGGLDAGFRSIVVWFPESETGLVLLSNLADVVPATPIAKLASLLFPAAPGTATTAAPASVATQGDRDAYVEFEGEYLTDLGAPIRISSERGLLSMRFQDRWHALRPVGPNEFMATAANVQLKFPAAGTSEDARFVYVGHPLRARRVERIRLPPAASLASLAGVYFSPEIDTYYRVCIGPGSGQLALQGGRIGSLPLRYFDPDLFVSEYFQQIRFVRNPAGAPTAMRIAIGRMPNGIEFRRVTSDGGCR